MTHPTEKSFLKNVKDHVLTTIKEDGVYRHLRISRPNTSNTSNMRYEIVTYPGGLVFIGDMGTFVFERITDMFEFFRDKEGGLRIDSVYYAEKCVSEDVYGNGIREFSHDDFKENVENHFNMYFEDDEDNEDKKTVRDEIDTAFEYCGSEWECVAALNDFSSETEFSFDDFWENSCTEKTYHFIWCLYAIVHAINIYDKENAELCEVLEVE